MHENIIYLETVWQHKALPLACLQITFISSLLGGLGIPLTIVSQATLAHLFVCAVSTIAVHLSTSVLPEQS